MPVTAKLSKLFYDRLGEQIANELVDWFNQVDATYRSDLRELNELNFARFDAKLEQRLAELDSKWRVRWEQLDAKLERRLAELDAKLEQRLAELDAKWRVHWEQLDAKLERRLTEVKAELRLEIERLSGAVATQRAELIRWMFAFWLGTILPLGGLIATLHLALP
jgi:hypothetical protein